MLPGKMKVSLSDRTEQIIKDYTQICVSEEKRSMISSLCVSICYSNSPLSPAVLKTTDPADSVSACMC